MTATGLTAAEVAERVADGRTNNVPTRAARGVAEIVKANVFTRINAILAVLLAIVLYTGSLINGLFGLLIVANSLIGIIQELRAKQTLDRLAIVGQAKPLVRRQSGTQERAPGEVVLDDVIELGPGDQIVVDGIVLEAANLEVDESLLTGEADAIDKHRGDTVMSGSFVVAGGEGPAGGVGDHRLLVGNRQAHRHAGALVDVAALAGELRQRRDHLGHEVGDGDVRLQQANQRSAQSFGLSIGKPEQLPQHQQRLDGQIAVHERTANFALGVLVLPSGEHRFVEPERDVAATHASAASRPASVASVGSVGSRSCTGGGPSGRRASSHTCRDMSR